ncbi:class I SAM-dependent methyltransferase [Chloroflexota bacterium]
MTQDRISILDQRSLIKLLDRFNILLRKIRPYTPFTSLNTAWRHIDNKGKSILDIGCGKGEPMRFINRHKQFYSVGLDAWEPRLIGGKEQRIHDDYILCNIRNLPIKKETFDIVLCLEVLEHLEREAGLELIRIMEGIARRQVIISTPLGQYEQGIMDGNPYENHVYIWTPNELKQLGYKVKTFGLRRIGGKGGLSSRLPRTLKPLAALIYVLAGPFTCFLSGLAGEMVCIKRLKVEK